MKFRKKPVVIEAWQNTDNPRSMPLWLDEAWRNAKVRFVGGGDRKSTRLNSSHSAKSRMPSSA